jgi:hypothetical protein
MDAPSIGGVQIPRGDGSTVLRLARGSSLTDFADKIEADPASLVTVLFHLGEMATATQSLDEDTFALLGAELGYQVQIVSPEEEDRELLESFDIDFDNADYDDEDLVARPPSSPSWVTSTTERPACWTRSGRPTWSRASPVASPSTSVPTRCASATGHHLHRHPGPRGIHRHACPWCQGH